MFDMDKGSRYISAIGEQWVDDPGALPSVYRAKEARRTTLGFGVRQEYWTLDYFFSPGITVRTGDQQGRTWERDKWTAHLYPPGLPYWETSEPTAGPVHSCWLMFRHGEVTGLSKMVANRHGFARFHDPEQRVAEHMRGMARAGQTFGKGSFWRINAMLFELIDILERSKPCGNGLYEAPKEDRPAVVHPMVVEVTSYMQKHLPDKITLDGLAAHARVSRSVLSHRYATETGEAPMRALMRMRIEFAKDLIKDRLPLKVIAERVGFCDEFHLSKVFTKIVGKNPVAFRKCLIGGTDLGLTRPG